VRKSQKGFTSVSRNLVSKNTRTQDRDEENTNRLKHMKKFYPEEYFRRSGYNFEPYDIAKGDFVYFKQP